MSLLKIHRLTHRYGDTAVLDDLSFSIDRGELVGLVGANGAGKSTLLRLIAGLIPVQRGDISTPVEHPRQALLGYCPQANQLWPDLTVVEHLRLMARLHGLPALDDDRLHHLLDQVSLSTQRHTLAGALSGGMKRRLALAIALLGAPPLLLLDEVDAGLDPPGRVELRHLLKRLVARGHAILLASHRLDEMERLANRLLILHQGKLIADGQPHQLLEQHQLHTRIRWAFRDPQTTPIDRQHPALTTLKSRFDTLKTSSASPFRLQVSTTDPLETLQMLTTFSNDHDLTITDLDIAPPSLEDLYLNLTGRVHAPS